MDLADLSPADLREPRCELVCGRTYSPVAMQGLKQGLPPRGRLHDHLDPRSHRQIESTRWAARSCRDPILVVGVVFMSIQNWRTTIIPSSPSRLVARMFIVLLRVRDIDQQSVSLGLVLAVGRCGSVDDAIVVVETWSATCVQAFCFRRRRTPPHRTMDEVGGAMSRSRWKRCAVFVQRRSSVHLRVVLTRQFSVTIAARPLFPLVSLPYRHACARALRGAPNPGDASRAGTRERLAGTQFRSFQWALTGCRKGMENFTSRSRGDGMSFRDYVRVMVWRA